MSSCHLSGNPSLMILRLILIIVERDATQSGLFIILQLHSTCFGCQAHRSSGVHKTVTTASGTGHIFVQLPSHQRGKSRLVTLERGSTRFLFFLKWIFSQPKLADRIAGVFTICTVVQFHIVGHCLSPTFLIFDNPSHLWILLHGHKGGEESNGFGTSLRRAVYNNADFSSMGCYYTRLIQKVSTVPL